MGLTCFQPFRPVGYAHGLVHFVTKSWTGAGTEYEVAFDVEESTVTCQCMDSVCRKKNFHKVGSPESCKHARMASLLLWPVIATALRIPQPPLANRSHLELTGKRRLV